MQCLLSPTIGISIIPGNLLTIISDIYLSYYREFTGKVIRNYREYYRDIAAISRYHFLPINTSNYQQLQVNLARFLVYSFSYELSHLVCNLPARRNIAGNFAGNKKYSQQTTSNKRKISDNFPATKKNNFTILPAI